MAYADLVPSHELNLCLFIIYFISIKSGSYEILPTFTCVNCIKYPTGTVYPKKYAHGFCFAVLCCGYTLTDFPISIRLTSLALWQSNDCPSASKATLMNMDKYFMWIHYERLHNHNKAKHNKSVCIFLGIYCITFNGTAILNLKAMSFYIGELTKLHFSLNLNENPSYEI